MNKMNTFKILTIKEKEQEGEPQENARNYDKPVVPTSTPQQASPGVAVGAMATVAVDPLNVVKDENKVVDKEVENKAVLSITTEPNKLLGKDVCDRATVSDTATIDVPLLGPAKQENESKMNEEQKKETLSNSNNKEKQDCLTTSLYCCIDTLDCTIM